LHALPAITRIHAGSFRERTLAGSIFKTIHVESEAARQDIPRRAGTRRLLPALARGLAAGAAIIVGWYQSFGDRRLLASLDDRQLRDLGLDRADLGVDSTASHWRLPGP
jgi:uncharacterized protein YjiS (DUF1127 family)